MSAQIGGQHRSPGENASGRFGEVYVLLQSPEELAVLPIDGKGSRVCTTWHTEQSPVPLGQIVARVTGAAMKLVRRLAMVVVLVALSIGALPALRGTETSAQVSVPHPCQVPAGFNEPVEIHTATASTTPRLVSSREVKQLTSQSPPPRAGISIEWAYTGWTTDDGNQNEVLFSGMWALPRTGALTFGGGRGAIVTVNEGDLVLLVCGANGEIDTTEHDNQSTALTAGSSTPIQAGTSFYVFLDGGPATYWLFGNRQGTPPEALVTIEIIGNNGGPSVCGITNCWPAPVLSAKPIASDCDGNTCKVINEPGGCGRIYCWTK